MSYAQAGKEIMRLPEGLAIALAAALQFYDRVGTCPALVDDFCCIKNELLPVHQGAMISFKFAYLRWKESVDAILLIDQWIGQPIVSFTFM
jgi:hypothetical protein